VNNPAFLLKSRCFGPIYQFFVKLGLVVFREGDFLPGFDPDHPKCLLEGEPAAEARIQRTLEFLAKNGLS
jgi:hypothetical protein